MRTALIAVDVQRDFIDGTLGAPGRKRVIPPLSQLAEEVDLVVASRDWHPPDHCSFASEPEFRDGSWPRHCVMCTQGAALLGPNRDLIVSKGMDPEREAYGAFDGEVKFGRVGARLAGVLWMLGVSRLIVAGLCTDYCVKATALQAVRLGFETTVRLDACAAVAPDTEVQAIGEMRSAGVMLEGS